MVSRHAQKSRPSVLPRSSRWKAWQCAFTIPGSCTTSATRERIRPLLRRLSIVGLAWVCLCMPAAARAGTVAIFYYPWYATSAKDGAWQHWNQNGHRPPNDLYSRFFPVGGPYSSSDPAVLERQMTQIASAGVDEVVISWWGRGSLEDGRLGAAVSSARRHGLLIGIHLEPYGGRTPSTVAADAPDLAAFGVRGVYVYEPRHSSAAGRGG